MALVSRIHEIEDAFAERIEALDADAYEQGSTTHTWHRSPWPFTSGLVDEALRTHLAFSVSMERADAGEYQDSAEIVEGVGDLAVVFYYRIRPSSTHALADGRLASRAARDILGALLRPHVLCVTVPRVLWRPGPLEGREWLPVELRCGVLFDLPIPGEVP